MQKRSKKYQNEDRFEFLLYINDNIICQRYFNIEGYNPEAVGSIEIKEMADSCVKIITDDLLKKTQLYLWKYYKPYQTQNVEDIDRRDIYAKIDNFDFEVRIDRKTLVKKKFSGNPYPPKVRYQVDIKKIIGEIQTDIRNWLTMENYVHTYGEIAL